MDADASVQIQIPLCLVRRILSLLTTLEYYIDLALETMDAADYVLKTMMGQLDKMIVTAGGQPHPFHGPIF